MTKVALWLCGLGLMSCSGPLASFGPPRLPEPGGNVDIFKSYSSRNNAVMQSGWIRSLDMSGVSFDQKRTATLITRRHVVMARHFSRKIGDAVVFHDREGQKLRRTLIRTSPGFGDVMVGLLDEPVPTGYHVYALPRPRQDWSGLLNRSVIVTDQNRRVFVHEVQRVGPEHISFKFDTEEKHGWYKKLIVGDSGNPSFIIAGGELVLVETHTTGGPGAGPFYGGMQVQDAVKKAVAELDSTYQIRTVNLP